MMRRFTVPLFSVVLLGVGTWQLGWWSVALLSIALGALYARVISAMAFVGSAAAVSWIVLLIPTFSTGRLFEVSGSVAGVMELPSWTPLLLTVVFPAVLGATCAGLGATVRRVLAPPKTNAK